MNLTKLYNKFGVVAQGVTHVFKKVYGIGFDPLSKYIFEVINFVISFGWIFHLCGMTDKRTDKHTNRQTDKQTNKLPKFIWCSKNKPLRRPRAGPRGKKLKMYSNMYRQTIYGFG